MKKPKPKPGTSAVWQAVGVRLSPALMHKVRAAAQKADPDRPSASAWVRKLIKRELGAMEDGAE